MLSPVVRFLLCGLIASLGVSQQQGTRTNWAGISNYYLYSCNSTIRSEALNAIRAAGLKVLRVVVLSTEDEGSVDACASSPLPDVEPESVGVFDNRILDALDDLMFEASIRGIKLTLALHDRWSLGCSRSDAYQRKYNLTQAVDCEHDVSSNDPSRFYAVGRDDFKKRIKHILSYTSRHTKRSLGEWQDALFSVEAENEAFGGVDVSPELSDWVCDMSSVVRANIHPKVLVTTGGGGIGLATRAAEYSKVSALAACASVDVVALHSDSSPTELDARLSNYKQVIGSKRLILQEWGATGLNSTAQAEAFSAIANVAAKHGVPQSFRSFQPSHLPQPSTYASISPPAPAPSPGTQRVRAEDGRWINSCTNASCPTEVWVTALYPAVQSAVLQALTVPWPEIWECSGDADCRLNGKCVEGACHCNRAWRGPTCAALRLAPTPRENGFRHAESSSWGGSIMQDIDGVYHMFASRITENCGLGEWSTNSEIVRATASAPVGPYEFREVVAERFAHEPNLVFGTGSDRVLLMGTMYPKPPDTFPNCSIPGRTTGIGTQRRPAKNTYIWSATSAQGIAQSERQLAIDAWKWDTDDLHNGAVCDTNLACAMGADGGLVGIWRHCETANLHTVPHTLTSADAFNVSTYLPDISINFPFLSHAGAEDPMVWSSNETGSVVFHAILHDEQITRCADRPVGCWPGGRHAFSTDGGLTWDYSAFDAYNGTVEYTDGTVEDYYLRARPHMLLDAEGEIVALSSGLRPTKASDYVFTLVQPVGSPLEHVIDRHPPGSAEAKLVV